MAHCCLCTLRSVQQRHDRSATAAHEAELVLGFLTSDRVGGADEGVTRGDREAQRWTSPDPPDGRAGLLRDARRPVAPRRPGVPTLRRRRLPGRPSSASRPGAGLPVRPLRPRLQRLHRITPARHSAAAGPTAADPPRRRPGDPHGAAGPRAGLRPQALAPAAAPAPGQRPTSDGPHPLDDAVVDADETYVNAGEKEASRTPTRPTRHGVAATGPSPTTGR